MSYETNEEHCTYAIFSNKYVMLKLFMKVRLTLSTFMQNIQNLKKMQTTLNCVVWKSQWKQYRLDSGLSALWSGARGTTYQYIYESRTCSPFFFIIPVGIRSQFEIRSDFRLHGRQGHISQCGFDLNLKLLKLTKKLEEHVQMSWRHWAVFMDTTLGRSAIDKNLLATLVLYVGDAGSIWWSISKT